MTCKLTVAGLPRAGLYSKTYLYNESCGHRRAIFVRKEPPPAMGWVYFIIRDRTDAETTEFVSIEVNSSKIWGYLLLSFFSLLMMLLGGFSLLHYENLVELRLFLAPRL